MSHDNNSIFIIARQKIQKYTDKMNNVNISKDKKQIYSAKIEEWYNVMVGGGCDNSIMNRLRDIYKKVLLVIFHHVT